LEKLTPYYCSTIGDIEKVINDYLAMLQKKYPGCFMDVVSIKDFGQIDSIFFAHSSNDAIRFQASSGGFIKSFLVYLLESLTVDFAIITRTGGSEHPLLPETIITNFKGDFAQVECEGVVPPPMLLNEGRIISMGDTEKVVNDYLAMLQKTPTK